MYSTTKTRISPRDQSDPNQPKLSRDFPRKVSRAQGRLGPESRTSYSISSNHPVPRFISRGNTFKVVTGDTVVLPCEIQNLAGTIIKFGRSRRKRVVAEQPF
ncbi:unnamed protein product [Phyllotreta striolata]|uniref:Uncharacterized protein n=1 Tax=Phyllotreta striolata TaxID=444603 RepID=A0A9N9XPL3_PHYSR|nr:unnamed protein product [Phyllotreta striolata]